MAFAPENKTRNSQGFQNNGSLDERPKYDIVGRHSRPGGRSLSQERSVGVHDVYADPERPTMKVFSSFVQNRRFKFSTLPCSYSTPYTTGVLCTTTRPSRPRFAVTTDTAQQNMVLPPYRTGSKPSSSATTPWPSSKYSLRNAGGSAGSVARGAGGGSRIGDFPRFLLLLIGLVSFHTPHARIVSRKSSQRPGRLRRGCLGGSRALEAPLRHQHISYVHRFYINAADIYCVLEHERIGGDGCSRRRCVHPLANKTCAALFSVQVYTYVYLYLEPIGEDAGLSAEGIVTCRIRSDSSRASACTSMRTSK